MKKVKKGKKKGAAPKPIKKAFGAATAYAAPKVKNPMGKK